MSGDYDINEAGPREYEFALRACREQGFRARRIEPRTEQQSRWAAEGEVPPDQMDCVRDG